MPSEAKIVFSCIAFYLVVGLYNYSGTGVFITPYFLNYFVLFSVSIYSFFKNRSAKFSHSLALYSVGILSISSSHSLTLTILNKWFGISDLSTITASDLHKLIAITIFYVVLFLIHLHAVRHHKHTKWFWLPLVFLIGSLIAVLINNGLWQTILLSAYMLSFIVFSNRLNIKNYQTYTALVFQFVLFLVLENIRFITTG